jgi:hypothetical protein
MYDHGRSLVNEMKEAGEPFALIGVNVNDELEHIQSVVKEKNLNWRSFFAGEDLTIPTDYNIQAFPTIVIIDAQGIVRSVGHDEHQIDVIHELLAEMKSR